MSNPYRDPKTGEYTSGPGGSKHFDTGHPIGSEAHMTAVMDAYLSGRATNEQAHEATQAWQQAKAAPKVATKPSPPPKAARVPKRQYTQAEINRAAAGGIVNWAPGTSPFSSTVD